MARKIIQITRGYLGNDYVDPNTLTALCDDGTLWDLNNGRKAFALYDLRKYPTLLKASGRLPINGIMLGNTEDDGEHITWDEFGKSQNSYLSIIGMWEEPIKPEDLPRD